MDELKEKFCKMYNIKDTEKALKTLQWHALIFNTTLEKMLKVMTDEKDIKMWHGIIDNFNKTH